MPTQNPVLTPGESRFLVVAKSWYDAVAGKGILPVRSEEIPSSQYEGFGVMLEETSLPQGLVVSVSKEDEDRVRFLVPWAFIVTIAEHAEEFEKFTKPQVGFVRQQS